jgi:2-polyprenyl-3-methyl-5-hydroxy-6-metoxy-1,4-benzoquinol methylase
MKSEKFWDKMSNSFEKEEKHPDKFHIKTINNTKKYLDINYIALDYGCATGNNTFEMADKVKKITGIDISSKMIEIANRKASERKIENVDFRKSLIFDERFEKQTFDVIIAFNILHLLEDNQKVIRRLNELLKPNGLFISTTPCLGEKKSFLMNFLSLFFLFLNKTGLVPNTRRFKISELENILVDGNFQIIETEKLYHGLTVYYAVARKK